MKKESSPFSKFNSETQKLIRRYLKIQEEGGNCFFDIDEYETLIDCFLDVCPSTFEAREVLQLAYKTYPNETAIKAKAAKILIFEDHYKKAIDILEQLPEEELDSDYIGMKGECYANLNRIKKAIETFDHYLKICRVTELQDVFMDITSIFNEKDKYSIALDYAEQGLALFPDSDRLLYDKAFDLVHLKRFEEAVTTFNTLLDLTPYDIETWRSLCITHMEMQNWVEALKCCDYILAIEPDNKEAMDMKADCLFKNEAYEEALAIYETLSSLSIRSLFQKAQCFDILGYYRNAIEDYNTIIKKASPSIAEEMEFSKLAYIGLTNCYIDINNDYNKAFKAINRAMKKFPDDTMLLFRAGQLESEYGSINNSDEYLNSAIEKFSECVIRHPENPLFNMELGSAFLKFSMFRKALIYLRCAERNSDTDIPNLYLFITVCYYALNDMENAKKYFIKTKNLYANAEQMLLQLFPDAKPFIDSII